VLGAVIDNPEVVLRDYDIVFARARCALESMAIGTALVVCGREGMGPMATTHNFDELRQLNFGMRAFRAPVTRQDVARVLDAYNADDAMAVSRRVRSEASLDNSVTQMLATYNAVIEEYRGVVIERREEDLAIARYVAGLPEHLLQIRAKLRKWRVATGDEIPDVVVDDLPLVRR
jgi:hypothetical protein